MTESCTCRSTCCDTRDEIGVCKGLPLPPRKPLVEVVLVHRSDVAELEQEAKK